MGCCGRGMGGVRSGRDGWFVVVDVFRDRYTV